ncbi:MAG: SPFH domain-containing protein [Candidatus Omnitrophica bacterium]|nr:SPFH domain-containing protein [Candidatus Omnitrophota bacterium]
MDWKDLKPGDIINHRNLHSEKVIFTLIGIIVLYFITSSCFVYIKPNEYGIKQVNIGVKTGIHENIYKTGYHFLMPFGCEMMHRFPRDIQVFELTNNEITASYNARREKAAHIQTSDGFFVDVDVTILYHIIDPYKVISTVGPGKLYEDNGIIPKVEPKLKEALGEMTTEEFYNSPLRVKKTEKAKQLLNDELNPEGIVVDHVLVRYFRYSEELQKNIEEKKLKDQLVFTNQSKTKASAEQALVTKVRQEGEANIKVKLEEGKAYMVKKNADRDLYVRTQKANADLLMSLAEAKKTELINQAYQNQGSENLIGLKMADVYKGLDVIMLPSTGTNGMNPLNLDKTMQLFGVKSAEKKE